MAEPKLRNILLLKQRNIVIEMADRGRNTCWVDYQHVINEADALVFYKEAKNIYPNRKFRIVKRESTVTLLYGVKGSAASNRR